jgi:flagellar M-ring protein FliF
MVTLGGIAMLGFVLFVAVMFVIRPHYVTLFANLTDQEQSAVAMDLQSMGIDAKFDRPGTIEVPSSDKDSARVRLAAANKLPKAQGQWGLGELNSMPFGVTPSVEQERLKAIAEGEIGKSIEAMDGVQQARVHLTLPTKSVFTQDQQPATASVSIVEAADADIGAAQGRTIAFLVKNAVDGLELHNIVVVNQHLKTIWNGADEGDDGIGGAEKKTDMDTTVSKQRARELQALLDGAFGAGAAIVTVHADVDMDPQKSSSVERTPTGASAVQTSSEQVSGGGSKTVGGPAGLASNAPGAPGAVTGSNGSGNYTGQTQTKENLYSETQTETTKAVGSIKAMAVNVVVDSSRVSDPAAVESVLIGDLGDKIKLDAAGKPLPNQAYTFKVTAVDFDKTAAKEAAKAEAAAASQARIQQIISLLPIAALLLVAAMVIRQIAKFARSSQISQLALVDGLDGNGSMGALTEGQNLSNLLAQIQQSSESDHHLRVEETPLEVEDIKNRVHIPLEQLKKMAQERPALVAMLIKSMLLEERK